MSVLRVLCVNLGSSSAKLSVLDVGAEPRPGDPAAPVASWERPLEELAAARELEAPDAVAYRVVRTKGIPAVAAQRIDEAVVAAIAAAAEFAPRHTAPLLHALERLRAVFPHAEHVAVYDSAFHGTIAPHAAAYGLPYEAFASGWRKVGFHGLSHAYAAHRTARLLGDATPVRKLVSAHLGAGASLAAIDGARSVDTTMGFTPLDGLIMATRSGALDPGMLLAYMRHERLTVDAAEELLSASAGLLGLGGSADMRAVAENARRGDERARLAYRAFVHRLVTAAGAMSAALGGLDALAFLGGIGENAPGVRADACAPLGFLGVALDPAANAAPVDDAILSPPDAAVAVLRIRTREDWMMALAARAALAA